MAGAPSSTSRHCLREGRGQGGVGLAVTDFGGPAAGPGILLLHGLMGRASTWWADASWLRGYGRVVAYDARVHGRSDAPAGPYDRDAFVGDAAAVIRPGWLALAPLARRARLRPDAFTAAVDEA